MTYYNTYEYADDAQGYTWIWRLLWQRDPRGTCTYVSRQKCHRVF